MPVKKRKTKRKKAPRRAPIAKRAKRHGVSAATYQKYLAARRKLAKDMLG